jgi:hypothetical protein
MKRRRKFGRILSLRENGLITGFNTLPGFVQRDLLFKEAFDQKYFEPTLEARPFMASFDTNQMVNQGQVFRVVRPATSLPLPQDCCACLSVRRTFQKFLGATDVNTVPIYTPKKLFFSFCIATPENNCVLLVIE